MQTVEQLREFFDFDDWANGLILASLNASKNPSALAIKAFAHLLIAEATWLRRFREHLDSTGFNFWPDADVAYCASLHRENRQKFT